MALKPILDTLDGVDPIIAAEYTQEGDKFILALDGVDTHPDVANLKTAYDKVKGDLKTAKTELSTAIKERPDDAALIAERQGYETQIATLTGERDTLSGKLTSHTRDAQLSAALTGAGITDPAFVKAATLMLADGVKMDGDKAVFEGPMGPVSVGDHVKKWVSGEGKAFVATAKGGAPEPLKPGITAKPGITGQPNADKAARLAAISQKLAAHQ